MSNYLYNGVELPALPEWDREKYPYALIYGHPVDREFCVLVCVQKLARLEYTRVYMENHVVTTPAIISYDGKEVSFQSWVTTKDGEKVPGYEGTEFTFSSEKVFPNGYRLSLPVVWSNFDLCYYDGEVFLPASAPVPVTPLDPTALLMGWLVGKRVAGLRKTQTDVPVVPDEPIAYLYNGERLPDINAVWTDKETYPYAAITKIDYSQRGVDASLFSLYLTSLPLSYDKVNDSVAWIRDTDGDGVYTESELALVLKDGISSLFPEQKDIDNLTAAMGESADGLSPGVWLDVSYFEAAVETKCFYNGSAIWTSHDILNTDGTTYLAASEPVPVYE